MIEKLTIFHAKLSPFIAMVVDHGSSLTIRICMVCWGVREQEWDTNKDKFPTLGIHIT